MEKLATAWFFEGSVVKAVAVVVSKYCWEDYSSLLIDFLQQIYVFMYVFTTNLKKAGTSALG